MQNSQHKVFLYDDKDYSYGELFKAVSGSEEYFPLLRTNDLFSFFVNFVKALIAGKPLTLIDSDINIVELDGIEEACINRKEPIERIACKDMGEVIAALKESNSEITLFTSGTTGQPKKVVHTVSTLTRSVRLGEKYANQVWAFAYNPTHMAGLQVFFQAFENQNTLVNVFMKSRDEVYRLFSEKQITNVSATPTFYRLLLPFEQACPLVRRVTLGGEKSDQCLYAAIRRVFPNAKINNVYASTEAGSLFASNGESFRIPEAIQEKIKVVDDELLIHRSLLGRSDSYIFTDDYYHTGDLIEWVDKPNAVFRFKSRKNDLINVGGYKVNPEEVELEIMAIGGVCQANVYGKANSILGEVLCADVVMAPNVKLTEQDIRKRLSLRLQDFKIPRRIRFVEELSVTRTGKLKRI